MFSMERSTMPGVGLRQKLLRKVNIFFAGVVAYNLVALILASAQVS